jgi:hypothetical protein
MYTSTFCKNFFEAISVAIEGFRFVEVNFFGSVNGLSHSECMNNRLVVSFNSGEEVFEGLKWRIGSRFGKIARFN